MSAKTNGWFEVDKDGLRRVLDRRGKVFLIHELVSNVWDTDASECIVSLQPHPSRGRASLVVTDDDPNGFEDLKHAFTLFADSPRKGNPEARGRFDFGEKLVLACCEHAEIASTTGTLRFDKDGRHSFPRRRRDQGSVFQGVVYMTRPELHDACELAFLLIPPEGVKTTFNGETIERPTRVTSFVETLPTVLADGEGSLRPTRRQTRIEVFQVNDGEEAHLFELGVPVVAMPGVKYHVNVLQKVPLNMDRDGVTPAYLRSIHTFVLNHTAHLLDGKDAATTWVKEAASDDRANEEAIERVTTLRFGERRVAFDPNDPEANHRAVAEGYTLVHGRMMSGDEWRQAKRADSIIPAGQIFPTPKPYSEHGDPTVFLDESEWTDGMRFVAEYAKLVAKSLGIDLTVLMDIEADQCAACYTRNGPGRGELIFFVKKLKRRWFRTARSETIDRLLIHEMGHHYGSSHLSSDYSEGCCRVGAAMVTLALARPDAFAAEGLREAS